MLPGLFSDGMVLQHDQPLPIWGRADPVETVTGTGAGKSASENASADGRWRVTLPKLAVHGDGLEMLVRGSCGDTVVVKNVLVAEVWLVTGPSNIFWSVRRRDNPAAGIAAGDHPGSRFFTVARKLADESPTDCSGSWVVCSPETVGEVSGVGYFLGDGCTGNCTLRWGSCRAFGVARALRPGPVARLSRPRQSSNPFLTGGQSAGSTSNPEHSRRRNARCWKPGNGSPQPPGPRPRETSLCPECQTNCMEYSAVARISIRSRTGFPCNDSRRAPFHDSSCRPLSSNVVDRSMEKPSIRPPD